MIESRDCRLRGQDPFSHKRFTFILEFKKEREIRIPDRSFTEHKPELTCFGSSKSDQLVCARAFIELELSAASHKRAPTHALPSRLFCQRFKSHGTLTVRIEWQLRLAT